MLVGGRNLHKEIMNNVRLCANDASEGKVTQACLTLCNSDMFHVPMEHMVHGILQARILEWVAFSFSRGSLQPRSPEWQTDSLPAEPKGKHNDAMYGTYNK